jgi:iron(III) transport system substrate-binding protein
VNVPRLRLALSAVVLVASACGGGDDADASLRLYTSVTQGTVDAVVAGFTERNPGVAVEVFRAPTGELTARIAAEEREGGVRADVLWLTDPLSMQQYAEQGLLAAWEPEGAAAVPEEYREEMFWGTRLLTIVAVHHVDVPAPESWHDLTGPAYAGGVAVPDPGFAGSALGALGYFALAPDFGFGWYEALADNGAVQVSSPGEVVTGVAEGRFAAGMTLASSARNAIADGSPIAIASPDPGGVAVYSPIAVVTGSGAAARDFVEFVLTVEAQEAIAATGWQPIRDDVTWPHGGPTVAPDWPEVVDRRDELLEEYRRYFGG